VALFVHFFATTDVSILKESSIQVRSALAKTGLPTVPSRGRLNDRGCVLAVKKASCQRAFPH
jgi:hypothetical protein